jgi:hypothetical protein
MAVKPTPTQDELNRSALGEHILEHEDDGSGPDPFEEANAKARAQSHFGSKALEADKPAAQTYQTRHTTAATHTRAKE